MDISSKISICIPTYNRADLLKKTLISASKQVVKPYEIIVVDNCSDDDTESVTKSFKGINYHRNERNLGLAGNWNQCIRLAKGEFLTILHSDDLISPDWCKEMSMVVNKYSNSRIGAFFMPVFTIDMDENSKIVYYSFYHSIKLAEGESIKILWERNMCGLPASGGIIFRKSIFNEIGMFDDSYTTETDTLTVLRVLNNYPVYYHKRLLYAYRIHPFQTFDKAKQVKSAEKKYSVLRNHLKIIKNFYSDELKTQYKQAYFYKRVVYMYLAIAVFNFITFKLDTSKKYYRNIKETLPEFNLSIIDVFQLCLVIFHYIYTLLWGRFLALFIKNKAKDWAKETV